MRRCALALLLAAFGCGRCGKPAPAPVPKLAPKPAAVTPKGCSDLRIAFAVPVTVRFCGKVTEVRSDDGTITKLQLGEPPSLTAICSGSEEHACLARLAHSNLARTDKLWAPRSARAAGLIFFFADAEDGDAPAIEIVQAGRGPARSVFFSEQGKTKPPFVFASVEDLDGDGVPELLGLQAIPELDECGPYAPTAVFKLSAGGFQRDEGLMKKWAQDHRKEWHGPEPDPKLRVCDSK